MAKLVREMGEWELAGAMEKALEAEDYEMACLVRDEVQKRRMDETLNLCLVAQMRRQISKKARLAFGPG